MTVCEEYLLFVFTFNFIVNNFRNDSCRRTMLLRTCRCFHPFLTMTASSQKEKGVNYFHVVYLVYDNRV